MKYEIYELYPSARHAYIAIGLAVKTSRPRNELGTLWRIVNELRPELVSGPYPLIVFSKNVLLNLFQHLLNLFSILLGVRAGYSLYFFAVISSTVERKQKRCRYYP